MSYIFECNDLSVWSPSLATGELFKLLAGSIESVVGVGSGLRWIADDMAQIEEGQFCVFVVAVVRQFESSTNDVWRGLVQPFVAVSIAVAQRCGLDVGTHDQVLEEQSRMFGRSMPWS